MNNIENIMKYNKFILIFVIVILIQLMGCKVENSNLKPNVVIIVMDTVRQDHLPFYGYHRKNAPNLSKLIKESKVFDNAYSTGGWTASAHASLFTGLYPVAHQTTQEYDHMNSNLKTMAEILLECGYETYGISENPVVSKAKGFGQGFLHFSEIWRQRKIGYNSRLYDTFKVLMKQRNKEKPFFLFINAIAAHNPYNSAKFFSKRFIRDNKINIYSNDFRNYILGKTSFSTKQMNHLIDLYDAEILYVDYLIGEIISNLKKKKILDNTLLIITSDHGENFGEHGLVDHVFSLHNSVIKIPMIIRYPNVFEKNSVDNNPVQILDLFPTVLKITGVKRNKYKSQGVDLSKAKSIKNRTIFSEYYYPNQVLESLSNYFSHIKDVTNHPNLEKYKKRTRAIISDNIKFIWNSNKDNELFDLKLDPKEENNLIKNKKYKKILLNMKRKYIYALRKYQRDSIKLKNNERNKIDKKTKDALKTLGYM